MTDDTTTENPKGFDRKPRKRGKPTAAASAALKLVSIDGIPLRDGRSKTTETTRAKALATKEPVGHRLTHKQESFAQHVAQGMTLTDAYKASYDTSGMDSKTIHEEACRLNASPKVAAKVEAIKDSLGGKIQHAPGQVKAKIIETLTSILEDTTARQADRMKAAELLGKWAEVAMFEERSTVKVETVDPAKAIEQLQAKLDKLKVA